MNCRAILTCSLRGLDITTFAHARFDCWDRFLPVAASANCLATFMTKLNRYGKWRALLSFVLFMLVASTACRSTDTGNSSRGIIVVNAPVSGEVRRVFVSDGIVVNEGATILEIAVRIEANVAPQTQSDNRQTRAARSIESAQSEVEAARAEVVRTEVEVQRLTPLAASADAPQSQLDGARADYDKAQQRLRKAQSAEQDAQASLVAARQPSGNPSPTPLPEQIVNVRATSDGTVTAISVQAGARVTAGQPLATLRVE